MKKPRWIYNTIDIPIPLSEDENGEYILIVAPEKQDGVLISGLTLPTIFIRYKNMEQFIRVLKHELVHLEQHKRGYVDEEEARKIVP